VGLGDTILLGPEAEPDHASAAGARPLRAHRIDHRAAERVGIGATGSLLLRPDGREHAAR
jgi:hypothetical protein